MLNSYINNEKSVYRDKLYMRDICFVLVWNKAQLCDTNVCVKEEG
jgi:hypothetical protein